MPGEELALSEIPDALKACARKILPQSLREIGGMMADKLHAVRARWALDRVEGVAQKCSEVGIGNPKEVGLSMAVPWLENASIEEDPDLQEMWESLLANAADPRNGRRETHRSFIHILKEIEAPERKVLEGLHKLSIPEEEVEKAGEEIDVLEYPDNDTIREAVRDAGYKDTLGKARLNLAKMNLVRLGLCSRQDERDSLIVPEVEGGSALVHPEPIEGPPRIHINGFGRSFYEACQPPESNQGSAQDE
jgi:hypothetical protein